MNHKWLIASAGAGAGVIGIGLVVTHIDRQVNDWLSGYDAFKHDADPTALWSAIDLHAGRIDITEERLNTIERLFTMFGHVPMYTTENGEPRYTFEEFLVKVDEHIQKNYAQPKGATQ